MNDEKIAEVCHQANMAICEAFGDYSQVDWAQAEQWQKDSALAGVAFARANPDAPPSAQHDAWMSHKRADGWKFGQVKDAAQKEHPCLVPYTELPPEQRAKDYVFRAIARSLLS